MPAVRSPRTDPTVAVAHLRRTDATLAAVIDTIGPCTLKVTRTRTPVFDSLVRAIIFQQLAGAAASTIHGRLCAIYGGKSPTATQLEATADAALRSAGVSPQKLGYLRDLSSRTLAGAIAFGALARLPDEEIIRELTVVKGIGEWTVQMLLMFHLHRGNVLPAADLGIRKGIQRAWKLRELPPPRRVAEIGAGWAPHRTVASWYLWRYADL